MENIKKNQGNVNYDHSKASLDAKVKAGNSKELHSDECDKLFEGGKIPSFCPLELGSDGGVSFRHANLRYANFRGVDLTKADFSGADLQGANFMGADLIKADFSGADLRGADFRGAWFQGTEIRDAFVEDADFWGAIFDTVEDNPFYTAPLDLKDK